MALLQSAFPNTRIDPETTVNLWYSLYCNEQFEAVKKATEIVITSSSFFPSHKEFGEALFRAKMLIGVEQRRKLISKNSEYTINKKLEEIDEMWRSDDF